MGKRDMVTDGGKALWSSECLIVRLSRMQGPEERIHQLREAVQLAMRNGTAWCSIVHTALSAASTNGREGVVTAFTDTALLVTMA